MSCVAGYICSEMRFFSFFFFFSSRRRHTRCSRDWSSDVCSSDLAIVRLSDGEVAVGDELHFHGHTSDFTEKVASMEVDHVKVQRATVGQEVAIQVVQRARPGDQVLKVT